MGEVLSVEQARAAGLGASYPNTAAGNAALDQRIVAAERWLASRIGPLLGEQTIERLSDGARVWIKRQPAEGSLVVTLNGDAVTDEVVVSYSRELLLANGSRWHGRLLITYDADDETLVREAVIKLLRIELQDTGTMQSENISGSGYSYTRGGAAARDSRQAREDVVLDLLPLGSGIGY